MRSSILLIFSCFSFIGPVNAFAQLSLRTIMITGDPAPTNQPGVCSRSGNLLVPPAMNGAGDEAFYSLLNTGTYGLYKTTPAGTVRVARQNILVPGLSNTRWAALGTEDITTSTSSSIY